MHKTLRSLRPMAPTFGMLVFALSSYTASAATTAPPPDGPIAALMSQVATLQTQVIALQSALAAANQRADTLTSESQGLKVALANEASQRIAADVALQQLIDSAVPVNLKDLAPFVHVEPGPINDLAGPHVIFQGANYHFRNGMERTIDIDGLGNLIVGHNEKPAAGYWPAEARIGSHNLVLGKYNVYQSYAGAVFGFANIISGPSATVTGGYNNTASGNLSSVSGGANNRATGDYVTISGGRHALVESVDATLPLPAYDSWWRSINQSGTIRFTHNLGGDTSNYKVDVCFRSPEAGIHNVYYGGVSFIYDEDTTKEQGAWWYKLDEEGITVSRGNVDPYIAEVRVRIWIEPFFRP